jgi:hypothetical protein
MAAGLFVAALQIHRLDDVDTWWHLATGRLIAARGALPAVDPFSYTAAGAPWINRQWLFELGLYGLWRLGGPQAVILGTGALFVAAFACAWRLARRHLPAWAAAIIVFLAAEAAVERFTARPEAATLCLLAVELLLLDGRLTRGKAVALALLQLLWANVHALSVLGLVPLGAELAAVLGCSPRAGLLADGKPKGQPVGMLGPAPAIAITGWATRLEHVVAPWRPPVEEALTRYQRGRAILTLFGRGGAPAARADFEAALRLRPDYASAQNGRRVALDMERP